MNRRLRTIVLGVLSAAAFWWASSSNADADVEQTAILLAGAFALSPERAFDVVAANVDDTVTLVTDGSRRDMSATDLARWLERFRRSRGPLNVALQSIEVTANPKRARLQALVVASDTQYGDLHAEERSVRAQFSYRGSWRLDSVELSPKAKHIPEARP